MWLIKIFFFMFYYFLHHHTRFKRYSALSIKNELNFIFLGYIIIIMHKTVYTSDLFLYAIYLQRNLLRSLLNLLFIRVGVEQMMLHVLCCHYTNDAHDIICMKMS